MVYNSEQKHTIRDILYFYNYYVKVFLCPFNSYLQYNAGFRIYISFKCNITLDKYFLLAYSVYTPWKAHEERCLFKQRVR